MSSHSHFLSCVERGRRGGVESLLAQSPEFLNARGNTGDTALHLAAWQNRAKIAVLLIEAGADVNARGNQNWTPLHYAAYHGAGPTLKILMEAGADLNLVDELGFAPLFYAAGGREPQCLGLTVAMIGAGAVPCLNTLARLGEWHKIARQLEQEPDALKTAPSPQQLIYEVICWIRVAAMRRVGIAVERKAQIAAETAAFEEALSTLERLRKAGASLSQEAVNEASCARIVPLSAWLDQNS